MRLTITGLMKGQNKNKKEFVVIHGTTPFTQYESENNETDGVKTMNVYTYLDCSILRVGDVVDLQYEPGFDDKATLVGFEVVAPFKESGVPEKTSGAVKKQ